jgi:hypothetical protein
MNRLDMFAFFQVEDLRVIDIQHAGVVDAPSKVDFAIFVGETAIRYLPTSSSCRWKRPST